MPRKGPTMAEQSSALGSHAHQGHGGPGSPIGEHAHQFDDAKQQQDATTLGMWIFLVTEVMFFGALFTGYAVYRSSYPAAFVAGSHELDVRLGGFNTVVLILSSLTMALGVHAAQLGKRGRLIGFLLATMVLGSVFLGVKAIEYHHKFEEHLVPGPNFHLDRAPAREVQLFFGFYFAMTGMHALHMIIGLGILATLVGMARRGRFTPEYHPHVEYTGLYWHFVDIIWIFLFPLLYLLGAR